MILYLLELQLYLVGRYKEFRQTNAYKTIATNYVGFNATNAEIKACLEWLIQKGKEGYQALPSTEEYRSAFGR